MLDAIDQDLDMSSLFLGGGYDGPGLLDSELYGVCNLPDWIWLITSGYDGDESLDCSTKRFLLLDEFVSLKPRFRTPEAVGSNPGPVQ